MSKTNYYGVVFILLVKLKIYNNTMKKKNIF